MDEVQKLQAEVIRLKARVLDAQDEQRGLSEVLGAIAKRVGFKGQSLAELVEAVPVVEQTSEVESA
ncbi:hypothetical protein [Pseudoalteromonas espejiana]|uniref:Uncharacterized protein n=1 Tax=Pseudoalteromonas espejiana TaxID=28107 RepID=A0A510XTD1_9GAMM|nr:hypothetical protein [Pseudoalteromonas espejiana]GEK54253.1 hypothetical protein PES01_10980 [Pseudoalteromonas espejiana]